MSPKPPQHWAYVKIVEIIHTRYNENIINKKKVEYTTVT